MRELAVPKFNNNDATFILVEWLRADGETVSADEVVAEIETSKAIEELAASEDGILHRLVQEKSECAVGQVIGLLFGSEQERQEYLAADAAHHASQQQAAGEEAPSEPTLTNAARELADLHGIGMDQLRSAGKRILKASDIEQLIAEKGNGQFATVELSRRQRSIAAVVSESHRTIPAAFAAVKVELSAFDEVLRVLTDEGQPVVGLPEALAKVTAQRRESFPLFFGSVREDHTVSIPGTADVGVTIDVGTGLFIPVLRKAADTPLAEIAGQLMDFRIKALREEFRAEELNGAHITLSLHNDPDIVLAAPIVPPGQTCVVTLCSTQHEIHLTGDGTPAVRPYVTIGVSYDHRVVNGSDAVRLLREIKRSMEDRSLLTGLLS